MGIVSPHTCFYPLTCYNLHMNTPFRMIFPVAGMLFLLLAGISLCPRSAQAAGFSFERSLRIGMTGEDVRALQVLLNRDAETRISVSGPGSPGQETTYFGSRTAEA